MSNSSSNGVSCSAGFAGVLTIIFVIAKIFDLVDWSWFLVFLPIMIYIAFVIGLVVVGFLAFVIAAAMSEK